MNADNVIDKVNEIVDSTNIDDFALHFYDGTNAIVVGSLDLAYYHELEIIFHDVEFISIPARFRRPKFRSCQQSEILQDTKIKAGDSKYPLFVANIEGFDTPTAQKMLIVQAESVTFRTGLAYHYARSELKDGERIDRYSQIYDQLDSLVDQNE